MRLLERWQQETKVTCSFFLFILLYIVILLTKTSCSLWSHQLKKKSRLAPKKEKSCGKNTLVFLLPSPVTPFMGGDVWKTHKKLPKCFLRLTGNLTEILCCSCREFKSVPLLFYYFCQVKSLRSTLKFTRLPSGYPPRSWRVTCCSQMFFFLIFSSPFSGN